MSGFLAFFLFWNTLAVASPNSQVSEPLLLAQAPTAEKQELTAASLEEMWNKRESMKKEILALIKSKPASNNYEVQFLLSRLAYFAGFYCLPNNASSEEKMQVFGYGVDIGEQARKSNASRVEGHYWYAVNLGSYGLAKGIMASLGNAKPLRAAVEEAMKIDEKYEHAGPYRLRGRLFFKLPGGFISFGDNKKAFEDLKKAVEMGPGHRLNYVYLAEVQAKVEDKEAALKTLEAAKKLPEIIGASEEAAFKRDLLELEKKLK